MKIKNSIAFVTGSNRGIGQAYVAALLNKGAKKVYAGMRDVDAYRKVVAQLPEKHRASPAIVSFELRGTSTYKSKLLID